MSNHSSYWLDRDLFADDDSDLSIVGPTTPRYGIDIARVARLAAVRRAVSNFVSILSGKNIPVEYSSGVRSYTDGERVVIAAEDDPAKFDVMVGLALHEGSHVLLSDFTFLRGVHAIRNNLNTHTVPQWWMGISQTAAPSTNVLYTMLPTSLHPSIPTPSWTDAVSSELYFRVFTRMMSDLHTLMNILEDRRIDQYVYQNAQGYRPYYDALYQKYFLTKEMEKNLRYNPDWRELTIENYINRLLVCFHPAADPDALPGLRALIDRMDLATISRVGPEHTPMTELTDGMVPTFKTKVPTFEETPTLWQEACHLYAHILKYVSMTDAAQKNDPSGDGEMVNTMPKISELPNLDTGPQQQDEMEPSEPEQQTKGKGAKMTTAPGTFNAKKGNKEMEDLKKLLSHDIRKKQVKKGEKEAIDALETANAELVDLTGNGIKGGRCMVLRKMTDALLAQDWFILTNRYLKGQRLEDAVSAGTRMGAILTQRLQVRNDPMLTKQTRLPHGGLDRRLLAQLGMDITSVFQKSRVDQHRPVMLHLTLDASGSMSGEKWYKVVTVATAIATLSSKVQNVDAVISIRGGDTIPIVGVLYDSRRDHLKHFHKFIRSVGPAGNTPESLCFTATMNLILENTQTHDVYFINFSDGEPSFSYLVGAGEYVQYWGESAVNHTRAMMKQMRDAGVKVLSYFISDSPKEVYRSTHDVFKRMYGEDASFVNVTNAGEVLKTLNKRLLSRTP